MTQSELQETTRQTAATRFYFFFFKKFFHNKRTCQIHQWKIFYPKIMFI